MERPLQNAPAPFTSRPPPVPLGPRPQNLCARSAILPINGSPTSGPMQYAWQPAAGERWRSAALKLLAGAV